MLAPRLLARRALGLRDQHKPFESHSSILRKGDPFPRYFSLSFRCLLHQSRKTVNQGAESEDAIQDYRKCRQRQRLVNQPRGWWPTDAPEPDGQTEARKQIGCPKDSRSLRDYASASLRQHHLAKAHLLPLPRAPLPLEGATQPTHPPHQAPAPPLPPADRSLHLDLAEEGGLGGSG